MKTFAMSLPAASPAQTGAVEVAHRLQAAGFIAYWAGGCVRDLILQRQPKDYDIATNAVPEEVLARFPESVPVGKSFGVVRVPVAQTWYDVATFRQDADYLDGRHPSSVTFSDPQTDAQRRDFTINALFYDPVRGEVIDFVEGIRDIQARVVATVGDPRARFREDYLRLLRAVRFTATLGFTLAPATAEAIREIAPLIVKVSAERIRDELSRLLTEARQAGQALVMLRDLHLLGAILPEVAAMTGVQQPPEFHPEGDVFEHTVMMLNGLHSADVQLAWAALLHDVGKPPTAQLKEGRWRFERHAAVGADTVRTILTRLRFSSDDIAAITFMVGNHMRFVNVKDMRRSTLRQLVGAPTFAQELELHRLDCQASHGYLDNYAYLVEFQRLTQAEPVLPKPWITGRDVMALGIPEGPQVGVWRKVAYEAQLEGICPDRDRLLDWLKKEIGLAVQEPES